ncbi:MAG TPA: response regulator transcription factor [Chloroflexota bacterium]|jgi:DNA-binding response OmpR family regulator|nr:response regulator transcription factor [Chloroflexota bacterium]
MTRILVVDDDPHIRQMLAYALADEGYQVDEAADGRAALEMVSRRRPDVILLDMKMPGMDGWEFARLYRERHGHQIPIVVLTAAPDVARRAADIDAEGYVSKPFDLQVLLDRVSAIAGSGEARGEPRPG